jgi:hypothetical protein
MRGGALALALVHTPDVEWGTNTLWLPVFFGLIFGLAYSTSEGR